MRQNEPQELLWLHLPQTSLLQLIRPLYPVVWADLLETCTASSSSQSCLLSVICYLLHRQLSATEYGNLSRQSAVNVSCILFSWTKDLVLRFPNWWGGCQSLHDTKYWNLHKTHEPLASVTLFSVMYCTCQSVKLRGRVTGVESVCKMPVWSLSVWHALPLSRIHHIWWAAQQAINELDDDTVDTPVYTLPPG